ncbi:MAG: 4-hydroxy-tetrahydrodipicolinate synthase [Rhodospirillaceae bacterium]|nr:4-hydroxy-tetrahydrodipicolinate synthase [Rhodospirillaceae bacterium]|tara:strand:+ start:1458 stop:2330 length:873 start_codon:yes stop_codon:yes gene_type:complete
MLKGSIVALATPFLNGAVDEKAFQELVEWQIDQGTNGLLPVGTTGESPTLSHDEHKRVVEMCIEVSSSKVPVLAGAGSNSTDEAVALAKHAKLAGADAVLVVTPYYNKPTQGGLFAHFKAIHDEVDIPIIVYNIPGRSVVDINQSTLAKLAELPNIIGIKDATSNISRVSSTRLILGSAFCQLSGEDATALAFMAHGGHGCISVTANVAPRICADFYDAWFSNDPVTALSITDKLMPLHIALFLETSPTPVKFALSLLGKCSSEVRLPLVSLNETTEKKIEAAMKSAGLI